MADLPRVLELQPGQQFEHPINGQRITYVTQTSHPIWPHMRLVVWRHADGEWYHDALAPTQVMDVPMVPSTYVERQKNLRVALLGENP